MSANVACLILVMARTTGALALSPLLGAGIVPMSARIIASAMFGLAVFPFVDRPVMAAEIPVVSLILATALEAGLGAFMGWTASMLVQAARMAGSLADAELQGAAAEGETGVLSEFQGALGTVIFFLVSGHHWFISGLLRSFREWRPGSFALPGVEIGGTAASLLAMGFEVAIKLAAPIMIVSLLVTFFLLLASRLFPAGGVTSAAAGLRPLAATGAMLAGVGLMLGILSARIPEFGVVWSNSFGMN